MILEDIPIMKRKVSFYKLSLEQNNKILENVKIEQYFKIIYDRMLDIDNGNKAVSVSALKKQVVIEVIDFKEHLAFVKIGQQNAANTVGLRDSETLKTEIVPMTNTQKLELFTYCIIDFTTGIISYIAINGAPRVSALKYLFKDFLDEYKIKAELDSILTNDILEQIVRKDIIGKMVISVVVPPDTILAESWCLDKETFDDFRNVKRTTVQYNIVADRNKNIFGNSSKLSRAFTSLKEIFGHNLKRVSVTAKNNNEKMQTYNLMEYNFSKTVDLYGDSGDMLNELTFYKALKDTYDISKSELLEYMR